MAAGWRETSTSAALIVLLAANFAPAGAQSPEPLDSPVPGGAGVAAPGPAAAEASLSALLRIPLVPEARERALPALEEAAAAARRGDAAAAIAAYDRALLAAPQFADWVHLLAAEAAAESGDAAVVASRLAATSPDVAREWGWRARVRALHVAGDPAGAARAAESAASAVTAPARRAAAWGAAGEAHLAANDTLAARTAFRRAMEESPGATAAVDAARAMSALPDVSPDDALLIGRVYLRHGNADRGVAGIDAYLAADRASATERIQLRLEAGRALFQGRRYDEAERRLSQLAGETVPRAVAAEALFLTARSRYRAGRVADGLATFREVIERYPGEPVAAEAAYILADLEQDEGRIAEATDLFERTMALRPAAAEAGLAAMRLGALALLEGDDAEAARIFEAYRTRFPQGRRIQQATYWAGRAYERLGREELSRERMRQARELDPFSYYGVRAGELLGVAPLAVPLAPEPRAAGEPAGEASTGAFRLGLLQTVGPQGAPAFEVERLRRHFDGRTHGLYTLAEALNEAGHAYDGILLGREIQRREARLNLRLLRIIYPFPYQDLILPEVRRHGLDPFLVAGLIRQESMFNPTAISPAGAIGLMQIMPATGRAVAAQLGMNPFDPDRDLMRPDINVRLGTRYFATRLEQYGGDVVSALAAYNAGAHRVERWALFPEYGADPELFAERIPFAETREYVKIVQANARIYAALYGGR